MTTQNETIKLALIKIKQDRLNFFRCSLTGAPFAQIMDDEIAMALESIMATNPKVEFDTLIDLWELKQFAYSTRPMPSLTNVNENALVPLLERGADGSARIAAYMLTRLMYPELADTFVSSQAKLERAAFARGMYDWLLTLESDNLVFTSQRMVAIDAYCAMPYWHKLWHFESIHSKFGLQNAHADIKAAFESPDNLIDNLALLERIIHFMFTLMLQVSDRDGIAGRSGSKIAQAVLVYEAAHVKVDTIPHFQKDVHAEQRARIKWQKALNGAEPVRIAHSAIHGKTYLPGGINAVTGISISEAAKASAQLKAALAEKSKTESKPAAAKAAKPQSDLQKRMAAAIANIDISALVLPGLKKD